MGHDAFSTAFIDKSTCGNGCFPSVSVHKSFRSKLQRSGATSILKKARHPRVSGLAMEPACPATPLGLRRECFRSIRGRPVACAGAPGGAVFPLGLKSMDKKQKIVVRVLRGWPPPRQSGGDVEVHPLARDVSWLRPASFASLVGENAWPSVGGWAAGSGWGGPTWPPRCPSLLPPFGISKSVSVPRPTKPSRGFHQGGRRAS